MSRLNPNSYEDFKREWELYEKRRTRLTYLVILGAALCALWFFDKYGMFTL